MTTTRATWTAGTLTITIGESVSTTKATKMPAFVVAGTGNAHHTSGIWATKHSTRAAALKAQTSRGEGQIVEVQ